MAKKESRFIVSETYGSGLSELGTQKVLVDKQTGVNYLFIHSGYGVSVTPLVDRDGKPIITTVSAIPEL